VLSRRTRALLLDARAAERAAPAVARVMASELGWGQDWVESQVASFTDLARRFYLVDQGPAPTIAVEAAPSEVKQHV
jgi:glycerol-3-phosphate dehydrogenase